MTTTTNNHLRIGTRGSVLALWQAEYVKRLFLEVNPAWTAEIISIKTQGDIIQDVALARLEGKAFFTKEIEDALLAGTVDVAVHSGKDLPTEIPEGLTAAGFLKRHNPLDAWISASGQSLLELPEGATVGTSSLRRRALLGSLRPDLRTEDLRGNIDTRLRKLKEGRYDAIVLAAAGLERLGLLSEITELLEEYAFPPAISQGAVAVETRADDPVLASCLDAIIDPKTTAAVRAERALLAALEGGCQVPLGALARISEAGELRLFAALLSLDGTRRIEASADGTSSAPEAVGESLAEMLRQQGGNDILRDIRKAEA